MIENTEIDTVGIREANRRAMEQAILRVLSQLQSQGIDISGISILIDGRDNYRFAGVDPVSVRYIVRGDATVPEIQAASILAKVDRDTIMDGYACIYPEYGFERHRGYGTARHRAMIDVHGITSIHRISFEPIKGLISEGKFI